LDELERSSQIEATQHAEQIGLLNTECDELRSKLSSLEKWKVEQSCIVSNVSVADFALQSEYADLNKQNESLLDLRRQLQESHRSLEEECNAMKEEAFSMKHDFARSL
jgi:FtsZ-binding cell division protein ZapB